MALTPVEIRHVELRRTWFRGYRRGIVERLLSDIADSFEEVWRERADLADKLEDLEAEASKHRELESLLRATLVSAERAAQDVREQARRESDLIVQEARAEGRRVARAAAAEKDRLEEEIRRIRGLLRNALEAIEAQDTEPKQETAAAPQSVEGVPDSFRRLAG
jgi:cell division initiation protein